MGKDGQVLKYVMALGLALLLSRPAYAYVDPGAGMLAIQGIIAAGVWIITLITHPVRTAKAFFKRWRNRNHA